MVRLFARHLHAISHAGRTITAAVDGAFEVPDEHAAELAAAFGMSKAPPGPTEIDQLRARIAELESVIETGKATNERQAARIAELEAQPAEGKKKRGG